MNEFEHPIGTKVWWVGMEYVTDCSYVMCEREVVGVRETLFKDEEKPFKQIFLSGLTSYEGENWFADEFQTMIEFDTEWHCSVVDNDCVFETEDEALRYLGNLRDINTHYD